MKIIFAGGGTAGHVNPAIAAANFIKSREKSLIWLCGGKGNIEEKLARNAGYEIYTFPLTGLSRKISPKGMAQNVRALRQTLSAVAQCKKLLRRLEPDVVVGTGGYASYPMVTAAIKCGVKTAILEVNATPGVTTKRLAPKVDCVMTSYADTGAMLPGAKKIVLTGLPVREEIIESRGKSFEPLFDNGLPTVTCFWGSVGALHMNRNMVDFISVASKRRDFNLLYASGQNHIDMMRDELGKKGVDLDACDNIDLRDYIIDMDRALALSSLVICRAGGTLAELCAAGKPSIIVPSPWVAENHQFKNAKVLENAGAAVVIEEKDAQANEIYTQVLKLLHEPQSLLEMGHAAQRLSQPRALDKIYDTLKELTIPTAK